ncbi:hypothetical protein CkaCkLH20_06576 [Colletotrichum karsti]|uniref:Uncharacterized protein n=1 Tax=Colletotrichum karsti TaxID=1095194 RepID=A0A9P6ICJ5_9PEZI|nr:uncharacterized protein CkaCkLH20_06576 [Colletotrichum karsti]KAF9876130.1 hypothetical protein CkaCkLH20_06576 [Colletotrichum karsti]
MTLLTYITASLVAGSIAGFFIDDWKINFSSMLREKKNEELLKKRERTKELLDVEFRVYTRRLGVAKIPCPTLVATSPSGDRRSYVGIKPTADSSVVDDDDNSRATIVD